MNLLIKGMEMPRNCNACELAALVDISDGLAYGCRALKEMISNDRERLPNCPLVPVPPHGRLIDADEVKRIVQEHDYLLRDPILNSTDRGMWTIGVFQAVDEAQTIIPASRKE